jgi:hypothetical protein
MGGSPAGVGGLDNRVASLVVVRRARLVRTVEVMSVKK